VDRLITHVNESSRPFHCARTQFPKDVNYYGKIKKAVSLPDQAKIDREVPLLPLDCELQICGYLYRGCAIAQGIGKEIIGKNR
jgi:hypothetical protein